MRLIVGLGNPGEAYKHNRHNVGFLLIDRLSKDWRIKIKRDLTTWSYWGRGRVENKQVILARPNCFMNLSGHVVKLLLRKSGLNPQEDMLVVFDDLDLELGNLRIRPKGSAGGHKGAGSIIKTLGNSDFARLRIGIGRPSPKKEIVDYVLGNWTQKERKQLIGDLERAADCCKIWVTSGITKAMNKFN
ncbi:MAG: aminoacyl-tRNA hydrolase [Candidatus Omnitrophota bacterium]|jgi:PTH1 family peptidyl-tRNA hydrolase